MSSTCILTPNSSSNKMLTSSSSSTTRGLPSIHPALRPSSSTNLLHPNSAAASSTSGNGLGQDKNYYTTDDSQHLSSSEILRDTITLLSGNNGPRRVIVSVFRTTVDHFALVYPDNRRKIVAAKPMGCINLRGVTCEETILGSGLKGFTLRPKKCDTSFATLIFLCSDENMLPKWLDALSPISSTTTEAPSAMTTMSNKRTSSSCRQTSLPSLEEEDE